MGSKLNAKGIVGNSVEEYRGIGLTCGSRESLWGPDMVSWKRNMTQAKAAAQFRVGISVALGTRRESKNHVQLQA